MNPKKSKIKEYLECDSFCPWCDSEDIQTAMIDQDMSIAWQDCSCDKCGREWKNEYRLVAISWLDPVNKNSDKNVQQERKYSDEL
jgi:transcription elongation factor Elf1